MQLLAEELRGLGSSVRLNVPLSQVSHWKIGGAADLVVTVPDMEVIPRLMDFFSSRAISPLVIGGTTNLLFADEGLRTPCIQLRPRRPIPKRIGYDLLVDADAWTPGVALAAMRAGWGGLEHICGIPGTIGGLIAMNGGSQRQSISRSLAWVESVTQSGEVIRRPPHECGFAYRRSVFQENGEVILRAAFSLEAANRCETRRTMREILRTRRLKFPRKQPSCGSVFKSDPELYRTIGPPGSVIEALGLKGLAIGGAQISPVHGNFIVNNGNATAYDVMRLVSLIQNLVRNKYGLTMVPEARYVTPEGGLCDPIL